MVASENCQPKSLGFVNSEVNFCGRQMGLEQKAKTSCFNILYNLAEYWNTTRVLLKSSKLTITGKHIRGTSLHNIIWSRVTTKQYKRVASAGLSHSFKFSVQWVLFFMKELTYIEETTYGSLKTMRKSSWVIPKVMVVAYGMVAYESFQLESEI